MLYFGHDVASCHCSGLHIKSCFTGLRVHFSSMIQGQTTSPQCSLDDILSAAKAQPSFGHSEGTKRSAVLYKRRFGRM